MKSIDTYTAQTGKPHRSFIITYQTVSTSLLQDYANAQAAYSLRKLDSSYTGNAITVRNSSGSSLDIGFDSNGDLDTAAILSHVGKGNGLVSKWYDQSGNGYHLSQITTLLMPIIASSGVIQTVNGLPAVKFSGDILDSTSVQINPNGEVNLLAVSQWDNTNQNMIVGNQFYTSNAARNWYYWMRSTGILSVHHYFGGSQAKVENPASATSANTQYIMSAEFAHQTANAYYNGTLRTGTTQGGTPENDSTFIRMGALGSNAGSVLRGYVQEMVYWSNTSHLSAEDISNDVNDYYSAF